MRMTGEQRIAASRQQVWAALNDPDVLRQCIPGCQSLEKESDERMRAVAEIRIGPIGARFDGRVTLSDLDAPNGYTITGEGQGGTVGFAKGGAMVRLVEDGAATILHYDVDAQVGGRLAQLGGPIIDATAKQLAGKFFARFGEVVGGGQQAVQPGEEAPSPAVAPAGVPGAAPVHLRSPRPAPLAWLLAVALAALAGYLVGHAAGGGADHWMGLAIGLALLVVGATGFEHGRRAAAPTIVLTPEALARLAGGAAR